MSSTTKTEKTLVTELQQGSQAAFEQLFSTYNEKAYFFAFRFLQSQAESEEVVQDAFVKVWLNREQLKPELSFNSYLFTIVKHIIFNKNRKKVHENAYIQHLVHHADKSKNITEHEVVYADLKKKAEKAIEQLPPQQKRVFLMSREQKLSHKEIAAELNLSVKTVEAHIRLALKALHQALDKFLIPVLILLFA